MFADMMVHHIEVKFMGLPNFLRIIYQINPSFNLKGVKLFECSFLKHESELGSTVCNSTCWSVYAMVSTDMRFVKILQAGFLGQKFFTLKVRKL